MNDQPHCMCNLCITAHDDRHCEDGAQMCTRSEKPASGEKSRELVDEMIRRHRAAVDKIAAANVALREQLKQTTMERDRARSIAVKFEAELARLEQTGP